MTSQVLRAIQSHVLVGALLVFVPQVSNGSNQERSTEAQVTALQSRATLGNRNAIRQLFTLRQNSDGHVAEEIDITLGKTIKPFPRIFLSELSQSGQSPDAGLLSNLGPEYVDRFAAQARERKARVVALSNVRDPALVPLRDKCIELLARE
jgi:hypothetical protein